MSTLARVSGMGLRRVSYAGDRESYSRDQKSVQRGESSIPAEPAVRTGDRLRRETQERQAEIMDPKSAGRQPGSP
jgi:hypothetical protein